MNLFHDSRSTLHASRPTPRRRRQSGSAVVVVIALLAIILVYVAGNLRTLHLLGRELKLLELQQTRRLQTAATAPHTPHPIHLSTNAVPQSGPR